jgi:hypothetical protein
MNRKFFILAVFAILLSGFASKSYKYKCPKCKLIQDYGTMGVKRCPNDKAIMIRQN